MRILICEDNKLTSKALSVVLLKEGYEVDVADDGNLAINFLKDYNYDLVLVDIHLPFHSGLEIIQFLRIELKSKTPVLILTAFSDQQVQRQANELEINGYIVKPFNPADLIKKIRATITI